MILRRPVDTVSLSTLGVRHAFFSLYPRQCRQIWLPWSHDSYMFTCQDINLVTIHVLQLAECIVGLLTAKGYEPFRSLRAL